MTERQKTIWLVEDEQSFADSLEYIFANISDLRLTKHFHLAEDLLEHVKSPAYTVAPDLILMDIRLVGGMSGLEAVEQLAPLMPGIPVVMMTMNDDQQSVVKAMQSGAVGYIIKGDPYDKVLEMVRASINGILMVSPPVKEHLLGHVKQKEDVKNYELTDRQSQVLVLMCDGMGRDEIAQQLEISPATADNHFRHIYQKLGVSTAQAAVAKAYKQGLI